MVDGGTIPHLGQKQLSVADNVMGSDVQSIFQIAAVTMLLMSVGKICEEGHNITFDCVCRGQEQGALQVPQGAVCRTVRCEV